MSLKKCAFSGVMATMMLQPLQLFAASFDVDDLSDARNLKEFRQVVEKQRNVSVFEKGGSLLIGGDVAFDGAFTREKRDGKNVNGKSGVAVHGQDRLDFPEADYKVKMSLSMKYTDDKSFADILLKADHHAGLDTQNYSTSTIPYEYGDLKPTKSGIKVEKAYFGTQLLGDDFQSFSVELGRQRYYDLFTSRITYMQRLEGLAFKYKNTFEGFGRFHATAASSVIANRANHYSFAGELGLDQLMDSPFGLNYSLYKINKEGTYSDGSTSSGGAPTSAATTYRYYDKAFNYMVSHVSAHYKANMNFMMGTPLKLYAGYAYNHLAKKRTEFGNKEKPHAWYAGITLGEVKLPGQGTLDLIYQHIQAESVPEFDNVGGYYGMNQTNIPSVVTPTAGFTNFQGICLQGGYLATKEILLSAKAIALKEVDGSFTDSGAGAALGYTPATSKLDFKKFEVEMKYVF